LTRHPESPLAKVAFGVGLLGLTLVMGANPFAVWVENYGGTREQRQGYMPWLWGALGTGVALLVLAVALVVIADRRDRIRRYGR